MNCSENSISSPNSPPGPIPVSSINPRLHQHLGSIISAALSAVDARRVTTRALAMLQDSLSAESGIRVVAAGKAAVGMARAVDQVLGSRVTAALMTARIEGALPGWHVHPATHPRPSAASEAAGRAALALADATRAEGGVLLVCLSGGASAMLAAPAEGLTIEDKATASVALLRAGIDIGDINAVRRHLSAIKGGQLAVRAGRAVTLAISDVCTPIEDDPSVIGSGPTAGDRTTFADALAIVERPGLHHQMPEAVLRHLRAGAAGEVEGPVTSEHAALRRSAYWIIASRRDAMAAAAGAATRLGYRTRVVPEAIVGPADLAPRRLLELAANLPRPACLISSGETTVQVRGTGHGGRNQELAVAALRLLADQAPAAMASIGTDGVDGPTDAAGAIVDDSMWLTLGRDAPAFIDRALGENDSYPLLDSVGGLVRTGPTGTNVGDIQVLLLDVPAN